MDLWIRSSAKTNLTKCDCLAIKDGEEIYGKGFYETDKYIICNCKEFGLTPLGTYKTKERALEVLDEIDECMSNAVNNGLNVARYVMPLE